MKNEVQTIDGTKFIGELPQSDHPWKMTSFGDEVYLFNPDHPQYRVIDGKLEMVAISELTDSEPAKDIMRV